MYYPKQIPYLLDKEFKQNIEYTEYKIKELEDYCMCIWTMKSNKILNNTISNNILPDACIDIIIDFVNNKICFAGFSKETEDFKLNKKIDYMGVRLKPSIFYMLYNIEAYKIMDNEIPFNNIEKDTNLLDITNLCGFYDQSHLIREIKRYTGISPLKIIENYK